MAITVQYDNDARSLLGLAVSPALGQTCPMPPCMVAEEPLRTALNPGEEGTGNRNTAWCLSPRKSLNPSPKRLAPACLVANREF